MKIIKIFIVVLIAFIILLFLGSVIFLKTVDINRFKTQIITQVSKSIGRDVQMRDISFKFSVNQGVTLKIGGLSIMDHPDFTSDPMLYIDSAYLDIDVLLFILKQQILISKVEFNSLKVNLIRNKSGEINFQKFTKKAKDQQGGGGDVIPAVVETSPEVSSEQIELNKKKAAGDFDFEEMLIKSMRITDGTFIFTDQTVSPPRIIPITQIEFLVSNLSFDAPVPFQATASLWSKRQNVRFNGSAQINMQNQQIRIDDLKVKTDLSDLLLDHICGSIPSLKGVGLKDGIEGRLAMDIHQMIVGKDGLLVLSSDGQLTDGRMQFVEFPVPIENLNVYFEITESDVEIKSAKMSLASGEIEMSGRIIEYLAEQKFLMDLNLKDVQLSEFVAEMGLPVKLQGQVYQNFKANGKGMGEEALKTSLVGEGAFEIKDGRVVDVNMLKFVLSKISFIPNLVDRIEENLSDRYKEKLKQKDTILEKVEIDIQIRNGTLFINKAELSADGFFVVAQGELNSDQNLSLTADFYISDDLSASMIASAEELSYFLNERNQVHIPLKPYNGKLAQFYTYPDIGDVMKKVIRNRAKQELKKIIDRVRGVDDQSPMPPSGGNEGAPQEEREISPEEAIIENILDIIPIFQ